MLGKKVRLQTAVWTAVLMMLSALCPFSVGASENALDTGHLVTPDLWIRAVINTDEKGPVEAVWHQGGNDTTAQGHQVLWGYFYASPSDVSWGSKDNPDVFVKIWFDADGRLDVSFFHVSVPDIEVYSDYEYDGTADEHGVITTSRRYIRHWYENGQSDMEENDEDGIAAQGYSPAGDPSGHSAINTLRIGAIINTVDGPVEAGWHKGGNSVTSDGHEVFWGYFYAQPSDVSWGSENNPDLFVKVWFDAGGRVDVNFFHVSVPDIEVCSDLPDTGDYAQKGTTILADRYIRHEYMYDADEADDETRPQGWTDETHGKNAEPNYDVVFSESSVGRIELVIDPQDWQEMVDDMTDIYGEFGLGGKQSSDNKDQPSQNEDSEACIGKNEGDACETTMEDQVMGGTCMAEGESLVCRPDMSGDFPGGKPGDGQIPDNNMDIMTDACVGKAEGDACEATMRDQLMSGICMAGGENLACRPDNMDGGMPDAGVPDAGAVDMSGGRNPIWKPCTFKFEDKAWYHAGVRFKGNSSLSGTWQSGILKLPLRFDFDQFEDDHPEIDDQRFYGFKKLTLSSSYKDDSLIREKVAADIFRDAGVPAPRTAFYRVYIDHGEGSQYFGLYTLVEVPADPMLETYFQNSDGNLYKPTSTFGTFDEASFDKENNEDDADWSDVEALFDALHSNRDDAQTWRAGLEKTLNVDGFLRWLAVNTLIQNWDTYGVMNHNYYLYTNPDDGQVNWIPWDNNEALKGSDQGSGGDRGPLSLSLAEVSDDWPLIRYLADDPTYWAAYIAFVQETAQGVFKPERIKAIYQTAHDLIRPYVVGDQGEEAGHTFLNKPEEFDTALEYLNTHVQDRYDAASQFGEKG